MDSKIITGIIAAGSAILGALITALAKGYTSRQKINELQINYENKLKDGYLEKAREYTSGVYIPLSISLAELSYEYQNFSASTKGIVSERQNKFLDSVNSFLSTVFNLSKQGANAFFTTDLDEILQSFCSFLTSSTTASEPQLRLVVRFGVSNFQGSSRFDWSSLISGKFVRLFRRYPISSINLGFFYFTFKGSEIVAAPIDSEEFQEQFTRYSHLINILIKEVTLGAKARR